MPNIIYPSGSGITARTAATLESLDMIVIGCDSSENALKTDYSDIKEAVLGTALQGVAIEWAGDGTTDRTINFTPAITPRIMLVWVLESSGTGEAIATWDYNISPDSIVHNPSGTDITYVSNCFDSVSNGSFVCKGTVFNVNTYSYYANIWGYFS